MSEDKPITDKENFPPEKKEIPLSDFCELVYEQGIRDGKLSICMMLIYIMAIVLVVEAWANHAAK